MEGATCRRLRCSAAAAPGLLLAVGRRDGAKFEFPEPTHSGWSEHSRVVDDSKTPHITASQAFAGLPRLMQASEEEIVDGSYGELAAEIPPGQNYLWHTERYGGRNHFGVAELATGPSCPS